MLPPHSSIGTDTGLVSPDVCFLFSLSLSLALSLYIYIYIHYTNYVRVYIYIYAKDFYNGLIACYNGVKIKGVYNKVA